MRCPACLRKAVVRHWWLPAGSVARKHQLTSIINLDDRFQATSWAGWLSSLDPDESVALLNLWQQSRRSICNESARLQDVRDSIEGAAKKAALGFILSKSHGSALKTTAFNNALTNASRALDSKRFVEFASALAGSASLQRQEGRLNYVKPVNGMQADELLAETKAS